MFHSVSSCPFPLLPPPLPPVKHKCRIDAHCVSDIDTKKKRKTNVLMFLVFVRKACSRVTQMSQTFCFTPYSSQTYYISLTSQTTCCFFSSCICYFKCCIGFCGPWAEQGPNEGRRRAQSELRGRPSKVPERAQGPGRAQGKPGASVSDK